MSDDFEYKILGEGPTLVLLHGYGGNPKQWDAVAMAMAKSYRVILPNLARTYISKTPTSFSTQVNIIKNLLEKVDDGSGVHIGASSFGGALAWAVAIGSPKLIQSLTLLSPMPPSPQARFRSSYLRRVLWLGQWRSLLYFYLKLPMGRRGLTRLAEMFQVPWLERKKANREEVKPSNRQLKVLVHVIHQFSHLLSKEDWAFWESRLGFIEQPVCLIWGEKDRLYEEDEPSRFLRLFNNGQLHHLEDTGHFSMTENPLPVVYILDHFLTRFQKAA